MSTTFNLTNSATEVNTALQAVVGADTAPTDGSVNMVTSDGVFTYVGTQVGALAGKTITTASTGIAATDNDTSIPTCAAVNAALSSTIAVVHCSASDGSTGSASTLPLTVNSDINGHATANSGVITLAAGTYLVTFSGTFYEDDDNFSDYHSIKFEYNGTDVLRTTNSLVPYSGSDGNRNLTSLSYPNQINETANNTSFASDRPHASTLVCTSASPIELKITNTKFGNNTTLYYKSVAIVAIKL